MTNDFSASIEQAEQKYEEQLNKFKTEPLNASEIKHWQDFIANAVMRCGNHFGNGNKPTIFIGNNLNGIDARFKAGNINKHRENSFFDWCKENGLIVHTMTGGYEILTPKMMSEAKQKFTFTYDNKRENVITHMWYI